MDLKKLVKPFKKTCIKPLWHCSDAFFEYCLVHNKMCICSLSAKIPYFSRCVKQMTHTPQDLMITQKYGGTSSASLCESSFQLSFQFFVVRVSEHGKHAFWKWILDPLHSEMRSCVSSELCPLQILPPGTLFLCARLELPKVVRKTQALHHS